MPSVTTASQPTTSRIAPVVYNAHEPYSQTQSNPANAPSRYIPKHHTRSSSDAFQVPLHPESTTGLDRTPKYQGSSEGRRPQSPRSTEHYPSMTVIMSQHEHSPHFIGHPTTSPLSFAHCDISGQSGQSRSRFVSRNPSPRARVTSCDHGRHYKCSPECSAALAPYNLLTAAIGRASAMDMRRAAARPSSEPSSPILRPSLQSRRSRQGSPTSDLPPSSHGLLAFDRKQWEFTPPLPRRELSKDQEASEGYFSDYTRSSNPIAALEEADPQYGFELSRSSSAPTVALITSGEHSPSDASVISSGTVQHLPTSRDTGGVVPASQRLHEALRTHVRPPKHDTGVELGRYATGHRKRTEETHRYGSHGRSVGGTSDFVEQLSPELAAILKQRLSLNHHDKTIQKEELLNEGNWSFDTPLAEVIHLALRPELLSWKASSPCFVAEYGCSKDTPNAVIMNVINAVASKAKIISISHQCPRGFDIRALQHALDESSYHQIRPQSVLSSFTFSNFADKVFAPGSIDIAVSGRELSELQGTGSLRPIHSTFSQAQDRERLADKEFTIWLKARAAEVKPGGLLVCFFCIRTCPLPDKRSPGGADSRCDPRDFIPMSPPRSPRHAMDRVMFRSNEDTPFVSAPPLPSPPMTHGEVRPFRPDIWRAMYHALSPAIQRLVTLGEISSHVAPVLVDVPFWPKTLASVKSTFARQQDWEVVREEEGGGEDSENRKAFCIEERQEWSNVGVRIHRLIHPAWKAYQDGEIDRASYARRVASYCRSVYESHLKRVLREKGRMDVSQSETTVQELFKILAEKCELGSLDELELDVGIVLLRRR